MALKVDYYTSLLRAVGDLDRDAYAARGAIYEREHKALMRLLYSADPARSEAEIEREQQAFREAVRRVEFGNDENDITLAPFSVPPRPASVEPAPETASLPSRTPIAATPTTAGLAHAPTPPPSAGPALAPSARAFSPPPVQPRADPAEDEEDGDVHDVPATEEDIGAIVTHGRKPIVGFLIRRAVLATVLLGLGAWLTNMVGDGNATADLKLPQWLTELPPWLAEFGGDGTVLHLARDPNAQQAIVIDSEVIGPDEARASGKAVWRLRMEAAEPQGAEPIPVLELDLEIPERHLAMRMSIRREAAASAMSHLAELRFIRENHQPDSDLANIGSLYMTTAEGVRRAPLLGRVLRVAPGIFLFGMAGLQTEREQNLRNLKELSWMAIPLIYRNGVYGTLIVEKGGPGERAINDALAKWGQGS